MADETDQFNQELEESNVLLSITDDWMLMGRLSGESLKDFKAGSIKSLIGGDYAAIEDMVCNINYNSRHKNFAENPRLKARAA